MKPLIKREGEERGGKGEGEKKERERDKEAGERLSWFLTHANQR